jgi:hypothetical protein
MRLLKNIIIPIIITANPQEKNQGRNTLIIFLVPMESFTKPSINNDNPERRIIMGILEFQPREKRKMRQIAIGKTTPTILLAKENENPFLF